MDSSARLAELPERIREKIWIHPKTGCWLWTASLNEKGYPYISINGTLKRAHIIVYKILVGPIQKGFELDHTCRIRLCVRFDHLEQVTHAVNMARSSPFLRSIITHCINGHKFTRDNSYFTPAGYRKCRRCRQAADQRSKEKRIWA